MGLSISVHEDQAALLTEPCKRLRSVAGLTSEAGDGLALQTMFVVPYKGMAVEGYYYRNDRDLESAVLLAGGQVARPTLDRILAGVGIPPAVLDESGVEQEISCRTDEPLWVIAWRDVGRIGKRRTEAVIEAARERFMAIHRSVVERVTGDHTLTLRGG